MEIPTNFVYTVGDTLKVNNVNNGNKGVISKIFSKNISYVVII